MNQKSQMFDDKGLRFFGKVTASVTHDIKNALATINENAGLLTDYIEMAARGRPLDPQQLNKLSVRIMDQVQRADTLLKTMNGFAHSVDDPIKTVNLSEMLQLFALLSGRFAAQRGITVDIGGRPELINIQTSPFLLLNALFLCLEFAMEAAGQGQCIELKPEKTDTGTRIYFSPLPGIDRVSGDSWPSSQVPELLETLTADFIIDTEAESAALDLSDRCRPYESR